MSEIQHKTFKYRLYPNREQEQKLLWTLDRCRELYNAALQERKDAYEMHVKRSPNYYDPEWRKQAAKDHAISLYGQQKDIPEIREQIRPEYQDIAAHVLRDPLRRVDRAFQRFFHRVKAGETPGYPRFQGRDRYDSFTYPDTKGLKVTEKNTVFPKIGSIKVKLHRPIEGKIKTVTIKREGTQWYVTFVCEVGVKKLPVSYEDVGIDLGITHFAALSDGEFIDNPRHYRKAEKKLAKAQQNLDHKKKGSHRREKAKRLVAKAHRKIRNQRKDFLHKGSRELVNRYQIIVFEDLQTANLVKRPKPKQDENGTYLPNGASAKAGLNKSINDAGWAMFVQMTQVKAACAGRVLLFVNPRYTSQVCSGCHKKGPHKDLSERTHICIYCGLVLDRDTNAAINIFEAGRALQSAMAVKAS